MDERFNFLFLTEEEAVKAGAGNMERCIEVMDEVLELLGQGDYLMGTPNHNAHGIKIYFPKEPKFPDMPKKGPDRRFMALVAYLGGRFHVCGEKWYGSNIANRDRGLPRSILTTLLNDPDTGAPIAFLSANPQRDPYRRDPRTWRQILCPQGRRGSYPDRRGRGWPLLHERPASGAKKH